MNAPDYSRHLETAIRGVKVAAEILMDRYNRADSGFIGRDWLGTVKTEADLEAERTIRAILGENEKIAQGHKIHGEEYGRSGSERARGEWYIDPLDGTSNFLQQDGYWGVMIAFADENDVKVGAIYLPQKEALLTSIKGEGVRLNGDLLSAPTKRPLSSTRVFYDTYADRRKTVADAHCNLYKSLVLSIAESKCSADSFHRLLTGQIEVLLEYLTTPWDDAAGTLMVRELGGKATTIDGKADWSPEMVLVDSFDDRIIVDAQKRPIGMKQDTLLTAIDSELHEEFCGLLAQSGQR